MVATIQLDDNIEYNLNEIAKLFHKKRNEIIYEAIVSYVENTMKKAKLLNAIEKTKEADKKLFEKFEDTIDDNL